MHCITYGSNSGHLSASAEEAALQQVSLLHDALHGSRVVGAQLYLLAS